MNKKHKSLFESFKINNLEMKNRFVMCAMATPTTCTTEGVYTEDSIQYYVERAKGGTGLLITGANVVEDEVEKHARAFFPCPTTDPHLYIASAGELTDKVHAFGSKIFLQLTAGLGRSAYPAAIAGECVAPSESTNRWDPRIKCREITTEEVESIVKKFIQSAVIAKHSGFDGVEIHAVHEGYLLDQFAMSLFNKRTDKYGGDLRGRLRFATEIVEGIKAACGKDFPVILRYSIKSYIKELRQGGLPGEEFEELGRDVEEALEAAKILEEAGYDAFDADAGTYDSWYWAHPPMYFEKGMYLPLAEQLKKVVNVPVIIAGRMDDPDMATKALADGKLDAIGLARPLLTDPQYVNKLRAGKIDEIRPCLSCHDGCFARKVEGKRGSCAINPECARELITGIQPANKVKEVMVIGGGPGGMEAARVSAIRGHKVTLYEASSELGGNLKAAGAPDFKEDDRELVKWYERQLELLNVTVNKNSKLTKEMVLSKKPDTVFVATGSSHIKFNLPGLDRENVFTASEVLVGEKEVKENVVIVGGGLVGCELALSLSKEGKNVTIVEALDDILKAGCPLAPMNDWMLRDLIKFNNINLQLNSRLSKVTHEGAFISVNGNEEVLVADNVVLACGFKKESGLYEELRFELAEIYNIGDSRQVRNIRGAIWDAYEVARSI
ncbi:FAD-dependent oxidoreductase [Oceanirhabdus seepicola]|uniref:FAD-dependent oxidoreductase n=1 Tax=Oceanirhabdus seepicola TaxID=2828781 RepID=A0A9J6NZT9_9CLOT|nr:FAD-dependent oxidoreductase [Oceanirhabdus seepicola]MCM1989478.1 FAD-dependent oxidoreductase [Oceanirhabdus seepicola]